MLNYYIMNLGFVRGKKIENFSCLYKIIGKAQVNEKYKMKPYKPPDQDTN